VRAVSLEIGTRNERDAKFKFRKNIRESPLSAMSRTSAAQAARPMYISCAPGPLGMALCIDNSTL
jgi:hypothetical protein